MTILIKSTIVGILLYQSVSHARHLAGDGDTGLALQIRVVRIITDIAFIFVAKAVLALANGANCSKPVRVAQSSIPALG